MFCKILVRNTYTGSKWTVYTPRLILTDEQKIDELNLSNQEVINYLERYVQISGVAPNFGSHISRERGGGGWFGGGSDVDGVVNECANAKEKML